MIQYKYIRYYLLLLGLALFGQASAQWVSHRSVLAEGEWYKIGVTSDGVYGIDYATLVSWGIDPQGINPSKIRLFGNVAGVLPESNAAERYDDLTEVAVWVVGGEDRSFDEGDRILFYGQGPETLKSVAGQYYRYERNPYTDTIHYYLCVNGEVDGMRIQEQGSVVTVATSPVIDKILDCYWHEIEELSPFASGRNWYGDLFTGQQGFKEFVIDLPDVLLESGLWVDSKVLVRCKPAVYYNLKVNGETLISRQYMNAYGDREYGREHQARLLAHPQTNPITLRYDFDPFEGNPMLFVDYFVLSYWRELRYHGVQQGFRVLSNQLGDFPSKVSVADAGQDVLCWEITDPIHPLLQPTHIQLGGWSFGVEGKEERRYHLFNPNEVGTVASCIRLPNQNLHALNTAELLIITPKVFWQQAQELAEFHRQTDGMDCVVTDVAEIYNEFATGVPDPTALRDFIRMIYQRSEGSLRYVLLLGKGSHDFRDIKGAGNNFVPTYENASAPYLEVLSMCSDDYYALMDDNEGEDCNGYVDLGVGRIPITTPEQGDAVIRKIKHYADPDACHGPWKNNHVLLADNDNHFYPDYAENIAEIVENQWKPASIKKLYMDSYPVVSSPSGNRVPMAHQILMDYFAQGMGVLSYTGHGGVKSLSSEWVLALSDIQSLTNFNKLPFVHTATCEFSKFDDPGVVSGGELMLLNPGGGAIALFTTMRPTLAMKNNLMSKALSRHLYEKEQQQSLRFGDIYRLAKADSEFYQHDNIVYVLFGDPALRFGCPSYDVVTEEVRTNGILTVSGYVAAPDGSVDTHFNGVMDVRLYDQKSNYTSLGNYDAPVQYSYHNDVLFDGKVSVVQGRFQLMVPVPANVSQGDGFARLSYYAYDTIRKVEACGAYDSLSVQTPTDVTDTQGPEIRLYWNTPDFMSGDKVSPNGMLCAELFDEHGIYHYNVSIGRDIVLNSNHSAFDNMVLNSLYEPALDDYQRGRVAIPFTELPDGDYEFTIKAWDTWNNSSEATVNLVVERNMLLAEVRNYPNPFGEEVWFSFVDGELSEPLEVTLEVFDVMGRCVARLEEKTASVSGVVPPIRWDGRSSTGSELSPGIYLYKMNVIGATGKGRTLARTMVKK